jgi:hypothetical protein
MTLCSLTTPHIIVHRTSRPDGSYFITQTAQKGLRVPTPSNMLSTTSSLERMQSVTVPQVLLPTQLDKHSIAYLIHASMCVREQRVTVALRWRSSAMTYRLRIRVVSCGSRLSSSERSTVPVSGRPVCLVFTSSVC